MIKRLRRKFVLIVMGVVTVILLAIFFTMLMTTQKNNKRMSLDVLHQALNVRPAPPRSNISPRPDNNPFHSGVSFPNMR